jgi:AcrR family transcriptional regulator
VATLPADMRLPTQDDPTPDGPLPLGPLPSGRHRYTPEQVAHHQRERLIAGLVVVVVERGYAAAAIGQIAAAAHVSRRVFYEHFESKEECFLAAFDAIFEHLRAVMIAAAAPLVDDWPRQIVAALRAALGFFAAQPDLANLCFVESPSAGPVLHRRFAEVATTLDPYLRVGRELAPAARELPEPRERSLIGAIGARFNREIALHGPAKLPELLPGLVEFVLTPYLGSEEARRYAAEAKEGGNEL